MRIAQKNLLLFVIFFGLIFGGAVFFAFSSLQHVVDLSVEKLALLSTFQTRTYIAATMNGELRKDDEFRTFFNTHSAELKREFQRIGNVADFVLLNRDFTILYSININPGEALFSVLDDSVAHRDTSGVRLVHLRDNPGVLTAWPLQGNGDLFCVLKLNYDSPFGVIVHEATLRFYLLGFSGLLGVAFIALFSGRTVKTPLRKVRNALAVLEKRKYGHRIEVKHEDEFYPLYHQVNRALERLEQLDSTQRKAVQKRNALLLELRTLSRFLDIMAHEVKNPLHALVINTDVLKAKIQRDKPKAETLKHAKIIEREIEHLQEVIQGFLNFVRPGVPQKEKVKLNDVVRSVCQTAMSEAKKAGVTIETRLAGDVTQANIDRSQFQQALHNIVLNAIHASPQGGKIQVRTRRQRKDIIITIRDSGVGMTKDQLNKVFDLYYTTKKNGSGIGLPITKRLIEANSGRIKIDSTPEKGTVVTITFRVAQR